MSTPSSLTAETYQRLRADVLACRLVPGQRLSIVELSSSLSVSPGSVREALSRLTSEGFVIAEPQRGFRVAPISEADLRDLTFARVQIEGLCLRSAVAVGSVQWESGLIAAYHELSRTPARVASDRDRVSEDWASAHTRYHEALVAGCDSAWLLRLRQLLYAQSERYRRLSVPLAREERNVDREHRRIMDSALARDADRAVSLLSNHITATTKILLRSNAVTRQPGASPRSSRRRSASR